MLDFWKPNLVSMAVTGCWVVNWYNLCHKSCCGLFEAGNGREIRVHKVNRRLVIFPGIVNEGFTILENSVHKIIFVK